MTGAVLTSALKATAVSSLLALNRGLAAGAVLAAARALGRTLGTLAAGALTLWATLAA